MSDALLEAQIATVFNFPAQMLCFLLGGMLVFVGIGMATIIPAGKWQARGLNIMGAGALIAFPAVMPMMLTFVGGSSDTEDLPQWLMPLLYVVIPLLGVVVGIWGWLDAGKIKVIEPGE